MISNVHVVNFKSLAENDIAVNKLTLLTGLNSSGKSSLIQTLRMLNQACHGKSFYIEELGNPQDIINKNARECKIEARDENKQIVSSIQFDKNDLKVVTTYSSLPEFIYVEAGRHGSRVSIPVITAIDGFKPDGDNILYFIDQHRDEEVGQSVIHEQAEGNTLLFNIRAWLKEISPNLNFDYQILLNMDASTSNFNGHRAVNVGFGLSYTLPVIAAVLYATIQKDTIVLLENPEAHLHPKGQVMIAKLICQAVQAGAQIIVETHSDHLFDGVRVFAKKNKDFAQDTTIHWFALDKDGNTDIVSPQLDDNGRLNHWPQDMFEQFEINASELL